jgi:hypothetical protein
MEQQQWTPYSEGQSRQAQFAPHSMTTPQQVQRDPNLPQPMKQEQYVSGSMPSRSGSMALPSPAGPLSRGPAYNDGDGDVPMEDADSYKLKYNASRGANHQHRHSQQFLQQEESTAARRYSPMNLSPTSPFSGNPQQGGQAYTSFTPNAQSNRGSPTRNNPYMSPPNSYYSPPGKSGAGTKSSSFICHLLMSLPCSFPAACASTSAPAVEHESRGFLPTVCVRATKRSIQQRRAVTEDCKPQSSTTAPHW